MDFAQQSYIKEFFLAPLRVACEQLFCYGVTAIDVQQIKSTEAKTSAYYQLARAINAESVAKRQLGLLVLPLNLVRLDHMSFVMPFEGRRFTRVWCFLMNTSSIALDSFRVHSPRQSSLNSKKFVSGCQTS